MKKILLSIMATIIGLTSFAQQLSIKGTVTDAKDGSPIPGVNISIKGTTKGTLSSLDGVYSINANPNDVIVFSFIGYENQEVVAQTSTTLDISLKESVTKLDEIVVIGYGTVKKSDATGSVAVVSAKEFNKGAITSPQDLIMGKTAGVVISTNDGSPGGKTTIRVRGGSSLNASNDPLIVIDGVPIDNTPVSGQPNSLSTINPSDIESFSVLKDASATAIYGSRASNGVIIITTKKGKEGKLKVSYNNTTSVSTIIDYYDVMSGNELRQLALERSAIKGSGVTSASLARIGAANTDWQKEIYQNAFNQDHNLSLSGGIKKVPFRISLGYTDQDGILKKKNMDRKTMALAIDPTFFDDHLKVNLNVKGMYTDNNFSVDDAIGAAIAFDPTQPVMNGNTRFGGYTTFVNISEVNPDGSININGAPNAIATKNPVAMINQTDNTATVKRSIGNAQFDYKFHFLPDLRANLNVGYDVSSSKGHDNCDTIAAFSFRDGIGRKKEYTQTLKNQLLDFYLNYVKDLSAISSKIDVTAGYSWQYFYREKEEIKQNLVAPIKIDTTGYKSENYLVSFFGRINYTLLDRYLLTFTLRNDGSSKFGEDSRWGLFPSVALGWKISDEAFLKDVSWLSLFKLRLGYGVTGQENIGDPEKSYTYYPYLATYQSSYSTAQTQFGNTFINTSRPNPYDARIKWEETSTSNIAVDYGFFKGRLNGSIEVYYRKTNDLISNIPIAAGTNFSNYLTTNVGNLENKGVEFSLNGAIVSQKDYFWEIGYNIAYNENEITKLRNIEDPTFRGMDDGDIAGGVGNKIQINCVGQPIKAFFVYQQVYDSQGTPVEGLYVDRSGKKGNVSGNNLNKYYYKKPAPDVTMGISTRGNIKNVDFSISSRINLGNYVYNNVLSEKANYAQLYLQSGYFNNLPKDVTKTNFANPQYWSDYYIENASFFKLDNISVGYNFDKIVTNKLTGRLGFAVQNVLTITKYTGLDPEVESGIDKNIYPRPRTYLVSLSLNF